MRRIGVTEFVEGKVSGIDVIGDSGSWSAARVLTVFGLRRILPFGPAVDDII